MNTSCLNALMVLAVALANMCNTHVSFATPLIKVIWQDPYTVLAGDTLATLSLRNSFYGQIDSCGITHVVGIADSNTTNNSFGLQYAGHDAIDLWGSGVYNSIRERENGFYVTLEAENEDDPLAGYHFDHLIGTIVQDSTASNQQYLECDPQFDTAGICLRLNPSSYAKMFYKLTTNGSLSPQVRYRMRVSDNSTADTVCVMRVL